MDKLSYQFLTSLLNAQTASKQHLLQIRKQKFNTLLDQYIREILLKYRDALHH